MSTSTIEGRTVNFDGKPVTLTNGTRPTEEVDPTVWGEIDASVAEVAPVRDDVVGIALMRRHARQTSQPSRWKRIGAKVSAILEAMAVIRPPFSAVHGPYTQIQVDLYREDLERRRTQAEMLRARL